jgi:hypothetical protein
MWIYNISTIFHCSPVRCGLSCATDCRLTASFWTGPLWRKWLSTCLASITISQCTAHILLNRVMSHLTPCYKTGNKTPFMKKNELKEEILKWCRWWWWWWWWRWWRWQWLYEKQLRQLYGTGLVWLIDTYSAGEENIWYYIVACSTIATQRLLDK